MLHNAAAIHRTKHVRGFQQEGNGNGGVWNPANLVRIDV